VDWLGLVAKRKGAVDLKKREATLSSGRKVGYKGKRLERREREDQQNNRKEGIPWPMGQVALGGGSKKSKGHLSDS